MKQVAVILAFGALLGAALHLHCQPKPEETRRIFSEIDQDLQQLTKISGFKLRQSIDYDLITRDRVNEFLKQRVKEMIKPEELRAEELALKKFGFVPQDFELAKTTVDLLTEQAAAFYDYQRKKLFVTDWASSSMQQMAVVHELAHALADQSFHLERFIKRGSKSDDSALARLAVMEGQATWLMSEVMAQRSGQSLARSPALLEMMTHLNELAQGQYPVFDRAPLYLRETLIFPYTKGMLFQQAVYEKMGQAAFTEVFQRAPVSTQQILHPQKYFDRLAPSAPTLPALTGAPGFKRLIEGTIGELEHAILLREYAGKQEAEAVSPHWRGGMYALLENKAEKRVVLAYSSEWDDATVARDFFRFYRRVLEKKWTRMDVTSETENSVAGTGDDGHFEIRLEGRILRSIEGLASPTQAKFAARALD